EPKRWSLQEEILKPLETALEHIQSYIKLCALKHKDPGDGDSYPDLKQEHTVYTTVKGNYGLYECRNAFWVWTKMLNCPGIPLEEKRKGPVFVGKEIKAVYLESDMIKETPSINELGVVTIELSGKWIAKCIHKMLKDGIETWAPKLPVKRVIVDYPSLDEEMHVDLFRRCSIRNTLMSILEYSKVDVTIGRCSILPTFSEKKWDGIFAQQVLDRWFPYEEIEGYVLIKGKVPFILPKRDFESAYKDIFALWNGLCEQAADWIIYLTPVRQQAYIEMCFAAAKLEGWMIPSDRHHPPRTSYAGYRACTTVLDDNLLDKAKTRCVVVEQGEAAKLLGYTAEVVLDCVFRYTSLKNHRLAVCTFDMEMLNEEGNTFVYLLNTQAEIRRITDDYHKDISELKKASELILENDEGWEEGVERILGSHLLEFTEALEESCSSVLPHILCKYLYDLAKKFNRYHSCVCKDGSVAASSTLLLYEATSVVMEKCFHLLGITATSSLFALSMTQLPSRLLFSDVERPLDAKVRYPYRNCRFELLSFRTRPLRSYVFDEDAKLHGLISASDKHGLLSDGGSNFFEPDFAHVPLFNYDCHEPINMISGYLVYLGHSTSGHSIPFTSFSSFIELYMELYVTKKEECHQVCNDRKAIDLSDLWDRNQDGACGCLSVKVEEGCTSLYYILLKDAVDTAIEVNFRTKSDKLCLKVSGYILAYYGDDFLEECQSESEYINKDCFYALLFLPKSAYYLKASQIPLIQSVLAVPTKGSLIIKAYVEDYHSREVIMNDSCKFKPQLGDCSSGTISGTEGCSLEVKVKWNYQAAVAEAVLASRQKHFSRRPTVVDFSTVTDFHQASWSQHEDNTCNRGGYCNFMYLKKLRRELVQQLFVRYIRRHTHNNFRTKSLYTDRSYENRDMEAAVIVECRLQISSFCEGELKLTGFSSRTDAQKLDGARSLQVVLGFLKEPTIFENCKGAARIQNYMAFGWTEPNREHDHILGVDVAVTDGWALMAWYTLNIWDVGGQNTIRSYWRNYFEQTDGLVWVVDSSNLRRLDDCKYELDNLLNEEVTFTLAFAVKSYSFHDF
ncbi:arginine--tRNA ligase, chloroplastic/mitochondrial, partial [Tanacetum coccineum]